MQYLDRSRHQETLCNCCTHYGPSPSSSVAERISHGNKYWEREARLDFDMHWYDIMIIFCVYRIGDGGSVFFGAISKALLYVWQSSIASRNQRSPSPHPPSPQAHLQCKKKQKYDRIVVFRAFNTRWTRPCAQKNHRFWLAFDHFEWILLRSWLLKTEIASLDTLSYSERTKRLFQMLWTAFPWFKEVRVS